MQKHLQAAKGQESIITHLEAYLIWLPSHIYSRLFLCFKISEAVLSPSVPLCTFALLRLLSGLFMSQDDEIKAVLWRFFPRIAAAAAACGLRSCSRFACLSRWCPRWKAEGQVTPLDLMLAPLPWLIHTICGLSEHINLLGNSFGAQSFPPFTWDTFMYFTTLRLFLLFAGLKFCSAPLMMLETQTPKLNVRKCEINHISVRRMKYWCFLKYINILFCQGEMCFSSFIIS